MAQHNGFIELHLIENTGENADKIGLLTAEFVHYTDCQQLKVWLPKSESINVIMAFIKLSIN